MRPNELAVSHANVVTNGVRLHYVELATERGADERPDERPVVLLLHGFPETWWSWRYQLAPLTAAGFRVLAPDLRGYNDSEKRGPYDLETLAADIAGLAEHFGTPAQRAVHVVAHDWGGAVAWHFAGRYPSLTRSLAVLNCPHPAQMQRALMKGKLRQLQKSWYMFFFQLPWLPERQLTAKRGASLVGVYRAHAVDRSNFSAEEMQPFCDAICKPGAASAALAYYRTSMRAALRRPTLPPPPPIEAPTLLLWGTEDKALGFDDLVPGTERYAPNLVVERIERCGHFVQQERPELVNERLLAFLTR